MSVKATTRAGSPTTTHRATLLTLAALMGATLLLSACNTTAGAGKDVSAAGTAVTDEANKLKPSSP